MTEVSFFNNLDNQDSVLESARNNRASTTALQGQRTSLRSLPPFDGKKGRGDTSSLLNPQHQDLMVTEEDESQKGNDFIAKRGAVSEAGEEPLVHEERINKLLEQKHYVRKPKEFQVMTRNNAVFKHIQNLDPRNRTTEYKKRGIPERRYSLGSKQEALEREEEIPSKILFINKEEEKNQNMLRTRAGR